MKSVLIASREILLWEMWHLFFILGLSLRFSSKIKQQLLNITAISVWCSTGGCRHRGVHFCAYVFISCAVPCVLTPLCVVVCLLCVRPAGFYRQNAFFPLPPHFFVVVVVTMAPAYFGPADHLLRIAKLLPPCHYGDTGCYTSANQCGVEDVKKLPGFCLSLGKLIPVFVFPCSSLLFVFLVILQWAKTEGWNGKRNPNKLFSVL